MDKEKLTELLTELDKLVSDGLGSAEAEEFQDTDNAYGYVMKLEVLAAKLREAMGEEYLL